MKMVLCAGAFALAAVGLLPNMPSASANEFAYASAEQSQMAASINIGRIRSMLRLTPQQEPLWAPVEAALREVARQQQAHSEPAGFVRRVSHRVVSIVLNSVAVERLAVAARPLIVALDDEQKRAASGLAHEMGLGAVVMAALK
jgi:zinc resistance-associated protein